MPTLAKGSLVLVTGGAGHVGAAVARRLLAGGFRVRVLDDLSRGRRDRLARLDVELIVDDVRSERATRAAVAGAAAVVHLAALRPRPQSGRDERVSHDVNVTGTLNLLQAARDARVARFIFGSSAAVYGARSSLLLHEDMTPHPICAEGTQKLAAEAYVRLFAARDGLPACVLRIFSVYGPGQEGRAEDAPFVARFITRALAGEPLTIHGDGSQTRDLIHVEDVAEAIVAALGAPGVTGRVLNVASGYAVSVRHVAALVGELVGRLPPPRYAPAPPGESRDVRASVAAAASVLGFRARIRLRDGLEDWVKGLAPGRRPSSPVPPPPPPPPRSAKVAPTRPAPASDLPLFADRPPSWEVPEGGAAGGAGAASPSGIASGDPPGGGRISLEEGWKR